MKQLLQDNFEQISSCPPSMPWRFLDLLRADNPRVLTFTAIAVGLAWVPPAILSLLHGWAAFLSFLADYASQSRFVVILPVLILAAPILNNRLGLVAHHFEAFVPQHQFSRFQANWNSFQRLRDSILVQAMTALLTYAAVAAVGRYVSAEAAAVLPWWEGDGGFRWFSPAGTYTLFISYPILVYFTLLWLWRQLLWTRFMHSTACLDLRLIAAHPDGLGGLGFLEASLRGQLPFSFCLGAGLAGAVANRVLHHGQKLSAFSQVVPVLVGAVLLVCVAPYFAFTPLLMQIRRRGLLEYGGIAHAVGEQFEEKWLDHPDRLNCDLMAVTEFSAVQNLYGVARNVNEIRMLPVGRVNLYLLIAAAFVPAIPVVIGAIPFDTLARAAVKMLF